MRIPPEKSVTRFVHYSTQKAALQENQTPVLLFAGNDAIILSVQIP
jgi:hypothetical protein